jgi:hypothetical protein
MAKSDDQEEARFERTVKRLLAMPPDPRTKKKGSAREDAAKPAYASKRRPH